MDHQHDSKMEPHQQSWQDHMLPGGAEPRTGAEHASLPQSTKSTAPGARVMWGMMLACALPILFVSIAGSGRNNPIVWAVLGLGLMVLLHWLVMRKHHRDHATGHEPPSETATHNDQSDDANKPPGH